MRGLPRAARARTRGPAPPPPRDGAHRGRQERQTRAHDLADAFGLPSARVPEAGAARARRAGYLRSADGTRRHARRSARRRSPAPRSRPPHADRGVEAAARSPRAPSASASVRSPAPGELRRRDRCRRTSSGPERRSRTRKWSSRSEEGSAACRSSSTTTCGALGRDRVQERADRVEELKAIRRASGAATTRAPGIAGGARASARRARSHARRPESPSASASSPRHMLRSTWMNGQYGGRAARLPGAAPVDGDAPRVAAIAPSSSASRVLPMPGSPVMRNRPPRPSAGRRARPRARRLRARDPARYYGRTTFSTSMPKRWHIVPSEFTPLEVREHSTIRRTRHERSTPFASSSTATYPTAAGLAALTAALDAKANNAPLDPALAARIKELLSALGAGDVARRRQRAGGGTVSRGNPATQLRARRQAAVAADARDVMELRRRPSSFRRSAISPDFTRSALARNVVPALEGLSERFARARRCVPRHRRGRRRARHRAGRAMCRTSASSASTCGQPSLRLARENVGERGLARSHRAPRAGSRDARGRQGVRPGLDAHDLHARARHSAKRPSVRTVRCARADGSCSRSATSTSLTRRPSHSGGCSRRCGAVRCGFRAKSRRWPATAASSDVRTLPGPPGAPVALVVGRRSPV